MFIRLSSIVTVGVAATGLLFAAVASGEPPSTQRARFHYAGNVVDERGAPIAKVTVTATIREHDSDGFSYIDQVTTDASGRFAIDRDVAMSGLPADSLNSNSSVWLECNDADHLLARREDLSTLPADALATLHVEMKDGETRAGRVVDSAGKPVAGALVRVTFGEKEWLAGKGAITNAAGQFAIRGLPAKDATISALGRRADEALEASTTALPASAPHDGLTLTVAAIAIPAADVREVLGMKLATLDGSTADALDRHALTGVLVLDPGTNVARLDVGAVEAGDVFWIVGEKPVATVDEFVRALLTASRPSGGEATYRVVYRFRRVDFDGTNTQSMSLTAADFAALNVQSKQRQ